MKKQTIIMDFSGIYREESFLKTGKYAGWIAETFQGLTDIVLTMHRKKSENEYKNIAMKVFISWIPVIIII